MARIPDEVIERLKREISLERLLESQGFTLKPHGKDRVTRCPFHEDDTPSLIVSPDTNLWHCMGACQAGGSVIDWVMKTRKVSFRHAAELLIADSPALVASGILPHATPAHPCAMAARQRKSVRRQEQAFVPSEGDRALLNQVMDFYHETLKQAPEGLAYLESRGINDPELIDTFRLGLANRTLGYRLPERQCKTGAALRGQLQRIGLLRSSGHEHFTGCIVIPTFDESGHVAEVYGRRITNSLRKEKPKHLYLPGPHGGVFNRAGLEEETILCESLIDALTIWQAGFRHVTASFGTAGFTAEMLKVFQDKGVKRILIAYDRDAAGNTAAEKVSEKLASVGIDSYRVLFPKGMDANEYARNVTPATKSLGLALRKAEFMGKGRAPKITTAKTAPDPKPKSGDESLSSLAANAQGCAGVAEDRTSGATKERNDQPEPEPIPGDLPVAIEDESLPQEPASPLPRLAEDVPAEVTDREVVIAFGDRRYRVRGLEKNLSYDLMKVNVLVSREDRLHVDSFDLYSMKPRALFIKQAAVELGVGADVIKRDLGKVLLKLEALQEAAIEAALKPSTPTVTLTAAEQDAALAWLKAPNLLDRLLDDFDRCGIVGEETNKLVGYLAAISRKLDRPLAVIIQSTSAAGKSVLMDAILALVPEEDRVHYSAMTGQSLFYMGGRDLKHKILAIAEEEGVQQASYALKLLQSQGELTIASTGKDATTGKLVTEEYHVEGPVMLLLTTTAIEIDEELLNRCLVLTVNESRDQTRAIHVAQRQAETLEGLLAGQDKENILKLHRNAQRMLRPLAVVNPFAEQLTFLDDQTRTRRDHQKYLCLIRAIALLHQYQRPVQAVRHGDGIVEYIEVQPEDIAVANRLAHEVLGRSLDELPPQTRRLIRLIRKHVKKCCQAEGMEQTDYRFSRRQIREATGFGETQLRAHLQRLAEMEYLLVHRGQRGQSFVYELLYDGDGETVDLHLMGLIDVDALQTTTESSRGSKGRFAGSTRPQSGANAGGSRGAEIAQTPRHQRPESESAQPSSENALLTVPKTPDNRSNGSGIAAS